MNKKIISLISLLAVAFFATSASASHSWGNYHWARTSNPFTLKLGNNLTSQWDQSLQTASSDWSQSSVLNTTIVPGTALRHRSSNLDCSPSTGTIQICNKKYGKNGWLGIAQIWATGEHITKGAVKLNDTYYNTANYNTPSWRSFVMCQEIGHTFGLDHQDENFSNSNLGTCMDYTSDPSTNQHPNAHDFAQLESIYSHLDSNTTISLTSLKGSNRDRADDNAEWGRLVRESRNGKASVYERDLGHGEKVLTHVIWAE